MFFSALYSLSSLFLPSLVGWGGVGDPFFHYLSGLPGHPGCHISSQKGGDGTFDQFRYCVRFLKFFQVTPFKSQVMSKFEGYTDGSMLNLLSDHEKFFLRRNRVVRVTH